MKTTTDWAEKNPFAFLGLEYGVMTLKIGYETVEGTYGGGSYLLTHPLIWEERDLPERQTTTEGL